MAVTVLLVTWVAIVSFQNSKLNIKIKYGKHLHENLRFVQSLNITAIHMITFLTIVFPHCSFQRALY